MKRLYPILAVIFSLGFAGEPELTVAILARNTNEAMRIIAEPGFRDKADSFGVTGLMYASSSGLEDIVAALLRVRTEAKKFISAASLLGPPKVSIDAQDKDGRTALIHAVTMRHGSIVRMLLDAGASKTLYTKEKKSAVDYAKGEIIFLFNPSLDRPPPSTGTPDSNAPPPPAASMVSGSAAAIHREQMDKTTRATWDSLEYARATDKKITGVAMNLLLPSLGSFVIGDFEGGTITLVLVAGTVVSFVLAAPIWLSVGATALTEIVNIACPLVYGTSLQNSAGVASVQKSVEVSMVRWRF